MNTPNYIELNGHDLTIDQVFQVARNYVKVEIEPSALKKVRRSQEVIEHKVNSGEIIYAVTTGFGANANKLVADKEEAKELQRNLLLSHACGVGPKFPEDVVRAIMCIRLNTLLAGHSGIRVETVTLLKELLNNRIHPVIPSQGSVGSSGDLCPLSHMAIVLIGEGYVTFQGSEMTAAEGLKQANLQPVHLAHKEGIALNNGTSVMTAIGALTVFESERLLRLSVMTAALAFESLCARSAAFDQRIHAARKQRGQIIVANLIRQFVDGSTYINVDQNKVPGKKNIPQDAYSVRCSPQVFGASYDVIAYAKNIIQNELNAVVDNPLIFPDDDVVLSGGNFHGQPVAVTMDFLKIGLSEIANISERIINKLLDPATNDGLPAFLVESSGLHSGFMIPQYVAASLVSENKVLAHPASVDSIPTSANVEDHVSMGTIAARQAREILENVKKVISIGMITSAQATELRSKTYNGTLGKYTSKLYRSIREIVPFLDRDRFLYEDINSVLENFEIFYALSDDLEMIDKNI